MTYRPPVQDMMFLIGSVIGLDRLPEHSDLGRIDAEMVHSILEPASDLAADVLAPLNSVGDKKGAVWKDGAVTTPPGFKEAYRQYCEGGWNGVVFDPEHGGQGLPWLVAFAVNEMWQGANMAFGLCPLLNQGAIEALSAHGSDMLKQEYLEKMVSGAWAGTMNLTEPQAGSDLAAVRTSAKKQADGTFLITGQKIFITYGEHDYTDNIIHLVLARIDGAPEGIKGISLFLVPKFLKDGARNDVICTGIEHKLGIHGSPTCTMQFGDKGGATGYLVGVENEGMKNMFTMMNNARLSVGLQGVAIAEAAYQKALEYARERVQGMPLDKSAKGGTIAAHADVKRMLLSMRALVEAGRAMTYEAALMLDLARGGDAKAQARADLMTPLIKAWCTDMAVDVASMGVQVHGGMGFIEEAGAAQFYRDARILPIYEGTNGIQAADLIFRKILRDHGAALQDYFTDCERILLLLKAAAGDDLDIISCALSQAYQAVQGASARLIALGGQDANAAAALSVPFQESLAALVAGMVMGRSALAAQEAMAQGAQDAGFYEAKLITARFFAEHILPLAAAKSSTISASTARTVSSSSF